MGAGVAQFNEFSICSIARYPHVPHLAARPVCASIYNAPSQSSTVIPTPAPVIVSVLTPVRRSMPSSKQVRYVVASRHTSVPDAAAAMAFCTTQIQPPQTVQDGSYVCSERPPAPTTSACRAGRLAFFLPHNKFNAISPRRWNVRSPQDVWESSRRCYMTSTWTHTPQVLLLQAVGVEKHRRDERTQASCSCRLASSRCQHLLREFG